MEVRAGDLVVFGLHLLCDFDLFEVGDPEEHSFSAVEGGLEVEEVVVFHLVVGGVWHGVVDDGVLHVGYCFVLGVFVLYLCASFVVEVYDGHADDGVVDLGEALVVLIDHFLEQECFPFELFIEIGDEGLLILCGEGVLGGRGVGLGC